MWGPALCAHVRKWDHAIVKLSFKLLKCAAKQPRRNFASLKRADVANAHNQRIADAILPEQEDPLTTSQQWEHLKRTMISAQECIPNVERRPPGRRWETSVPTQRLADERASKWENANPDERKALSTAVKRSARNDYRSFIDNVVDDIEEADKTGDTSRVYKLARCLSSKSNSNRYTQPSTDSTGTLVTNTDQQLDAWAGFLEKKFARLPGEVDPVLPEADPDEVQVPTVSLDEVKACVKHMKCGKSTGPDTIPIEQFKASDSATKQLHSFLCNIFDSESIPDDYVMGDMMLFYKKKCKNDRCNYRCLGLLNHGYKAFAMLLLGRMLPYLTDQLSDMQAGFRKGRGCRDNITILMTVIRHMLDTAEDKLQPQAVFSYIDFTAAFDTISHTFLLETLVEYGVPMKYIRLVKAIYENASVRVRLLEPSGQKAYSRSIPIRRGVIQGDIPSPMCFLVALDKLLKDHSKPELGVPITNSLMLSELAYADDAALPSCDASMSTERLTSLAAHAKNEAGMSISIPKTKAQYIVARPKFADTTEEDVLDLKPAFVCDTCDMAYLHKRSLNIHKGRWCGRRNSDKKPSCKGTVADRAVKRAKTVKHQKELDPVKIGNEQLDNVYTFTYLGAEVAGDGDPLVPVQHRCNVAWAKFNEYRKVLTSAKLPVAKRVRLYKALVVSAMTYSSEAWFITPEVKRLVNNVNSKMLSQITKRSIHEEAGSPTLDVIEDICKRRWTYLGHIARMPDHRALKQYIFQLSTNDSQFVPGSLLDGTSFRNREEVVAAAADRIHWRRAYETHRRKTWL